MEDTYEDDFLQRRALTYTLNFTCKTYLFGPINNSSDGLIKKVQTDYYSETANIKIAARQQRYTATPAAIKDYNNDNTAATNETIDTVRTEFDLNSAIAFRKGDYIQIDEEKMLIRSITGNRIKVKRGMFTSVIKPHDINVPVNVINVQDDVQVIEGDDFGFGETRIDFADGEIYSSSQGRDSEL